MVVTAGDMLFVRDRDYALDPEWGTFGRLPGGRIGEEQPVAVEYRYGQGRIDTVAVQRNGQVRLCVGTPHSSIPQPPGVGDGAVALANIWVPARLEALGADQLFPITETCYPEPPMRDDAETCLPETLRKLRAGLPLRILAWGDSVTDGSFLPAPETERWQEQFVARLRARFPHARIELVNLGWGGRNTESFLREPAGSPFQLPGAGARRQSRPDRIRIRQRCRPDARAG